MNFKKVSALACAITIVGGMATSMPVLAAEITPGTTPVTYDNREVLPDGNGEYGMIIPTAITFDDKKITSNADISITGINGWDLDDWQELKVKAKVKSQTGYKLQLDGTDDTKYATYNLQYNGAQNIPENQVENDINVRLGVSTGGNVAKKVQGKAMLRDKSKATVKGQYKDTLTYSFEEVTNIKK